MRKIILILALISFVYTGFAQIPAYRGDLNKLIDVSNQVVGDGNKTLNTSRDTVYYVSEIFHTQFCDSLFFNWEYASQKTLIGFHSDSLQVYLRIQWYSPNNTSNTPYLPKNEASFATQDSVHFKPFTTLGNIVYTRQPWQYNANKTKARIWVRVVNNTTTIQRLNLKVWSIKRWND